MRKIIYAAIAAISIAPVAAHAGTFVGVKASDGMGNYKQTPSYNNDQSTSGWMGGAEIGYDSQISPSQHSVLNVPIIIGAMVDAQWGSLKGSRDQTFTFCNYYCNQGTTTLSSSQDWLASAKAFVGIPVWNNRVTFYGDAGYALGGVTLTQNTDFGGIYSPSTYVQNYLDGGLTYGAGIAVRLDDAGTYAVAVEYNHYDLKVLSTQSSSNGYSYTNKTAMPANLFSVALRARTDGWL